MGNHLNIFKKQNEGRIHQTERETLKSQDFPIDIPVQSINSPKGDDKMPMIEHERVLKIKKTLRDKYKSDELERGKENRLFFDQDGILQKKIIKTKQNMITQEYLRHAQKQDLPFQEIDLPLNSPRILKKYTFDETRGQQGRINEFRLEPVQEEKDQLKEGERSGTGHGTFKKKTTVLKDPTSSGGGGTSDKNEEKVRIELEKANRNLTYHQSKSFGKQKSGLKKGEDTGVGSKSGEKTAQRSRQGNDRAKARLLEAIQGDDFIKKKQYHSRKIVFESDDEIDIAEVKDIDPLMILNHQNMKPTEYIKNSKYMGDRFNDQDRKFLAERLPNLFKNKGPTTLKQLHEQRQQETEKSQEYVKPNKIEPIMVVADFDDDEEVSEQERSPKHNANITPPSNKVKKRW